MELGDYKIKVTTEAESKEVIYLLIQVGYKADQIDRLGFVCTDNGLIYAESMAHWDSYEGKILTIPQLLDIVAQSKSTEQGLISGKEALIALANGKEVEYWCESDPSIQKRWTPIKALNEYKLSYFLEDKPRFEFRLKPRTIKLNIEIPAPFEPKGGDEIWFLNPDYGCGYADGDYDPAESVIQFGVWRTEAEIKQVVAALRGALKNG